MRNVETDDFCVQTYCVFVNGVEDPNRKQNDLRNEHIVLIMARVKLSLN